jgi:hypothetical protein
MIKPHSDDPDVADAAAKALAIINETLDTLPKAERFDYGGHDLKLGEYGVCERCTVPIAEAQAAEAALRTRAESIDDQTIAEHVALAADLLKSEAQAATIRAELHNGHGSEKILNRLLGYAYERSIGESYDHSHHAEPDEVAL